MKVEKVEESKKSKVENVHVGASVVPRGYLFLLEFILFCARNLISIKEKVKMALFTSLPVKKKQGPSNF